MNGSVGSLRLLGLAAFLIFSVMACLLLTRIYGDIRYLALATVVVAITTFLGFLDIGLEAKKRISLSNSDMRTAIAASFIVTYLTIAGLVIFFTDNAASTLPEIARVMLTNFTATVGIVIAFYFGATAYVDANKKETINKDKEIETGG